MLHTKFRGNRPAGSGEEDFEGFSPYMDMEAILDILFTNFHVTKSLPTQFG